MSKKLIVVGFMFLLLVAGMCQAVTHRGYSQVVTISGNSGVITTVSKSEDLVILRISVSNDEWSEGWEIDVNDIALIPGEFIPWNSYLQSCDFPDGCVVVRATQTLNFKLLRDYDGGYVNTATVWVVGYYRPKQK